MTWHVAGTIGVFLSAVGLFVLVLVANLEPQPEYPRLMTDLLRLLGALIGICGLAIGAVFLFAAGTG